MKKLYDRRSAPRRATVAAAGLVTIMGSGSLSPTQAFAAAAPSTPTRATAVIVRATPGRLDGAERAVRAAAGRITRPLTIINGFAAVVPSANLDGLAANRSIFEVTTDASVKMDSVVPSLGYDPKSDNGSLRAIEQTIGATNAWADGFTGAGVDVALLDTGVTPVAGLDAPGKVVNGPDLSVDAASAGQASLDAYGHGTHMASIIAGRDGAGSSSKALADATTFAGVAPDAGIVNIKVGSQTGAVDVSQVIAGIDWAVQNATTGGRNIKVLNLSFGTRSVQSYTLDPVDYAAEVAWRRGIAVVVSAGNDGSATTSLQDPANDPFLIAVGAENTDTGGVLKGGGVATFTNGGNAGRTVDVLAPGVHVLGLDDPGSFVDTTYPTGRVGARFFRGSGTSQAAAVVSGAMALLAQRFPAATPDQLKYLLTSTARPLKSVDALSQGHGVIQVGDAVAISDEDLAKMLSTPESKGPKQTPEQRGTSLLSQVSQPWVPSTGDGSLDAARGGSYLVGPSGQPLSGPQDVWGSAVNTASLASAESSATSWSAGSWNGQQLIGSGATATWWDGTATAGVGLNDMRWTNMRWSGGDWSNMRWADESWSNMRWAGGDWSNMRWAGGGWG